MKGPTSLRRLLPWHGEADLVRRVLGFRLVGRFGALVPVSLAVLATALGLFSYLTITDVRGAQLGVGQALYRTARLFMLNLDVPPGVEPTWELWIAAVAAPLATLRVLLGLAHDQLRSWAIMHLFRGHVVVCGAGARGALIARRHAEQGGLVVLVDPRGQDAAASKEASIIAGDATVEDVLVRAGIARASRLVAVTGDDYVNAAIGSAARSVARSDLDVYVHLEQNDLARIIDGSQPADSGRGRTIPFNSTALAAAAAVDEIDVELRGQGASRDAACVRPLEGERSCVLIFGAGPLVEGLVLELHRRWQVARFQDCPSEDRPLVAVFDDQASDRVRLLRERFGAAMGDIQLEAYDTPRSTGLPLAEATERLLRGLSPVRAAWVVDDTEIAGLRLGLAVSQVLGPGAAVMLLCTAPIDSLTEATATLTRADGDAANVLTRSVVGLVSDLETLSAQRPSSRLQRALTGRRDLESIVEKIDGPYAGFIEDDPIPVVDLRSVSVHAALGLPGADVFARASLRVDILSLAAVEIAGPALLRGSVSFRKGEERSNEREVPPGTAFEYFATGVRDIDDPAVVEGLRERLPVTAPSAALEARDVRRLLSLKQQALKSRALKQSSQSMAIVAGAAGGFSRDDEQEARRALTRAFEGWEGCLLSGGTAVGVPGLVGSLDVPSKVGYLPRNVARHRRHDGYDVFREGSRDDFSVDEPLRAWRDLLAEGVRPQDVVVIVFDGGPITRLEFVLARALGAVVVAVTGNREERSTLVAEEADLRGVLELPCDGWAIAEVLRSPRASRRLPAGLEALPALVHEEYRRAQAGRKPASDPAMQPWDRLAPTLRVSNEDQVRHIPIKLARLGKEYAPLGEGVDALDLDISEDYSSDRPLPEPYEELARMEHGRWLVERRRAGWIQAERVPSRLTTPHLVGWDDLAESVRAWDREAVLSLPRLLAVAGMGIRDLSEDDERTTHPVD